MVVYTNDFGRRWFCMPINDYNNPYYWGFKMKIILDFNNYGTIKDKNRKDKKCTQEKE